MNKPGSLHISRHAYLRAKERVGWNRKTLDRMIGKIYGNGERLNPLSSSTSETILYGNLHFIFKEDTLVTIIFPSSDTREKNSREKQKRLRMDGKRKGKRKEKIFSACECGIA